MTWRYAVVQTAAGIILAILLALPAPACCPAPPRGKPVVNADQTVIILWDEAAQTQHFIRRANFKSAAADFGFIVPTPTQPELNESGNEAFPFLQKLTEPEIKKVAQPTGGMSCGCGGAPPAARSVTPQAVRVLEEKMVAGFNAVILEARSAEALVTWLQDNGYAFSPEIEAWAQPYVQAGWKFTALKVAKPKDDEQRNAVAASALRMTFKTERPLFPYREPDPSGPAQELQAKKRLLRIYFLAEARYQGDLTKDVPWTGQVAWANQLSLQDRKKALELLQLPATTGPGAWWLTEFEDAWPYRAAPGDVYFSRSTHQDIVKRPPIIQYVSAPWSTDIMTYAIVAVVFGPPLLRRVRRGRQE